MTGVLKTLTGTVRAKLRALRFAGSSAYWEQRYASGGDSGVGSYGKFAQFKAQVINDFVRRHAVRDVIEFGCGDGAQLSLADYPKYVGFDVSETAVALCRQRFSGDPTKTFRTLREYESEQADLALSLDVIYHLVEDEVFDDYMATLFMSSRGFVIIYASNATSVDGEASPHVKHRVFTDWVAAREPSWRLIERIPNAYPHRGDYREGSFAEFHIYERVR